MTHLSRRPVGAYSGVSDEGWCLWVSVCTVEALCLEDCDVMVQFDCQILQIHAKKRFLWGEVYALSAHPYFTPVRNPLLSLNAFLEYFAKGSAMK